MNPLTPGSPTGEMASITLALPQLTYNKLDAVAKTLGTNVEGLLVRALGQIVDAVHSVEAEAQNMTLKEIEDAVSSRGVAPRESKRPAFASRVHRR